MRSRLFRPPGAFAPALRLWLITVLLVAGAFTASPAAAQNGGVTGFVTDVSGRAISNATIRAVSGPSAGRSTTSAANGSYLLNNLLPGDYTFSASRTGFITDQRTFTVLAGTISRLDFTLSTEVVVGGSIQGTVLASGSQRPIPNATVELTLGGAPVAQTLTDSTGFYRFTGLSTGAYTATVRRAGFNTAIRSGITVINGRTTTANFTLTTRAADLSRLQGRITNEAGVAIRNAQVMLLRGLSAGATATSSTTGNYVISGIVPDTYDVLVQATGFQDLTIPNLIIGTATTIVQDVTLIAVGQPTATLRGTITNASGGPIQGALVQLTAGPDRGRFAVTDAAGFYELRNVTSGDYSVTVAATNFQTLTETVTLFNDTVTTLNLSLADAAQRTFGTITGRVTDSAGTGVPGVEVTVLSGPLTGSLTTTDEDGRYSLQSLPAGIYSLRFARTGFPTRTITNIVVSAGGVTVQDVQLDGGTGGGIITGTVRDNTGALLSGVLVQAIRNTTVAGSATTNGSGTYTISGLAAGTYSVRFTRSGFSTVTITGVSVTTGGTTTVNASLTPDGDGGGETGDIVGRTQDTSGRAVSGILVELTGPSGPQSDTTDASGQFSFLNLQTGTYTLRFSGQGINQLTRTAVVTAGVTTQVNVTVTAQPGLGFFAGTVRQRNGLPIEGATVAILTGPSAVDPVTTSPSGSFNIAGLLPGRYTARVSAPGFRSVITAFNVRPGQATFRNFFLQRL